MGTEMCQHMNFAHISKHIRIFHICPDMRLIHVLKDIPVLVCTSFTSAIEENYILLSTLNSFSSRKLKSHDRDDITFHRKRINVRTIVKQDGLDARNSYRSPNMLSHNLLVNTGNVLSLSEARQKASQNSTDELIETLKIILNDKQSKGDGTTIINGKEDTSLQDVDRKDLKITVKVFISSPDVDLLKEALDQAFKALRTNVIESLVIAYKSAEDPENMLSSLKRIWSAVEEYVKVGKLSSVGLSDINTNTFIELFQWADVKPNIVQINLATCCVVPPALQEFTKENDIQLLTHSDPCEILPQEILEGIFGSAAYLRWLIRYQIHLKCRGILSSKGYLLYINKSNFKP